MSLKKRDRSEDEQGSEQESKREKRRRQRDAARRQKALAETERKRRKEAEKASAKEPVEEEKPEAEKPQGEKPGAEKPKTAKAPSARAKKPPRSKKPSISTTPAKKAAPAAKSSLFRKPGAKKPEAEKPETSERPAAKARRGFASGESAKKASEGARKVGTGVAAVAGEVLKLGREMLVIPLQLWLGLAEVIGGFVLTAWRRAVLPALRLALRFLVALLHFGERHVTPARALGVVALVAIGVLVASQWRDYSAVSVGVDAYAGDVGAVAPAPEVSSAPAHDAHGPTMFILAALAAVVLVGAFAKRRRLSVWLVAIGVAVVAVSLLVDAPKGLDEGDAAVAYESANAALLSGFWIQIAAGVVLIGCGLLLPRALRPARAPAPTDAKPGPSIIDRLVARGRTVVERRRARPKTTRRLPKRLRRPAAKGKVQGAGT